MMTDAEIERDIRTGERWLIAITAASVIMSAIIALIYYGQLKQMKKATDASTRAADTAAATLKEMEGTSADTHELAVQAKNQADRTKDVADRALAQAKATNELAREAKRTADANKESADAAKHSADTAASQLELAERPWVNASTTITGPLVFTSSGVSLPVTMVLKNTGHSPAEHTAVSTDLLFGAEGELNAPNYRQRTCGKATTVATAAELSESGFTLFPQADFEAREIPEIPADEIENGKVAKEFPGTPVAETFGDYITRVSLVVCIAYRPTFNQNSVYHTAYIFDLWTYDAQNQPSILFKIGESVAPNHLVLRKGAVGAIRAD